LKFSFFMYSGLPYVAVVQTKNPAMTIPAGTANFHVRMIVLLEIYSLRLKAYREVSISWKHYNAIVETFHDLWIKTR